jgi:hypothetical protein
MASPLAQMSHNRRRGGYLTPLQRGVIIGAFLQGATRTQISAASAVSRKAVNETMENASTHANEGRLTSFRPS